MSSTSAKSKACYPFQAQSDAELLMMNRSQQPIPDSFKPYLHLQVNADGTPIDTELDDVEMAVALSTLVSIIVDNCSEQTQDSQHVLQHVVNPQVIGMMQQALRTVGSVAPRTKIDCNPIATSADIRNTLQKLETLQSSEPAFVPSDISATCRQDEHSHVASISLKKERSYHCEFCGSSFDRRASFARHQQQHFSAKPFECGVCLKRFSVRCRHKQHMAKEHS